MRQEKEKGPTNQIKKLTSNLEANRKNVDSGNEIPESIDEAK